jgi:two-component system response regulator
MEQGQLHILLVEDNPADVLLTRMAIEESGLAQQLMTIADGESALAYLRVTDRLPDLILLDLNLPELDGFAMLEDLRKLPHCANVPVAVLSASRSQQDRHHALDLGARAYFAKPSSLSGYTNLARELAVFCQALPSTS